MWSAPAKNMKKINMSISFVYGVSILGNCENAVFTFLLFYKQNPTCLVSLSNAAVSIFLLVLK